MLGVPPERVFEALQVYLGSAFVNDFNLLGRTYRVTAQADAPFRATEADIANLQTRSNSGAMVPLGSVATFQDKTGPYRVVALQPLPGGRGRWRYGARLFVGPVAEDDGEARGRDPAAGLRDRMDRHRLSSRRRRAARRRMVFALAVLFVFLVLAAQYRKPDAAAVDHPDRADVPAGGDGRRESARAWTTMS